MSWISLGGERNFNNLMHYTKHCSNEWARKQPRNAEVEEGQAPQISKWQYFSISIGATVATIPEEFLAAAENLIRLPFHVAGALVKYPVALTGLAVKVLCCGNRCSQKLLAWQRDLPGITDVLKTAYKVIGFVIGMLLTATLGFISTKANYRIHSVFKLIDPKLVDPLFRSSETLVRMQADNDKLEWDISQLRQSLQNKEGHIARIQREKSDVDIKLNGLRSENARLTQLADTLRAAKPADRQINQDEMFRQLESMPQFQKLLDEMLGTNADLDAWKKTNSELEALRKRMESEGVKFNDQGAVLACIDRYQKQNLHLQLQLQQRQTDFDRQLKEMKAEKDQLRLNLDATTKDKSALSEQLAQKTNELERFKSQVFELRQAHGSASAEAAALQKQLEGAGQAKSALERQLAEKREEIASQLQGAGEAKKALEQKLTQNHAEIARLQAQVQKQSEELRAAQSGQAQLPRKSAEIEELKRQLGLAQQSKAALESQLKEQKATIERLQTQVQQTLQDKQAEAAALKVQLQGAGEAKKALEQKLTQNHAEIARLQAQVQKQNEELRAAQAGQAQLPGKSAEIAELKKQLDVAEQSRTNLDKKLKEQKDEFEKLQAKAQQLHEEQLAGSRAENEALNGNLKTVESDKRATELLLATHKQELAKLQQRIAGVAQQVSKILSDNNPDTIILPKNNPEASEDSIEMVEACFDNIESRMQLVRNSDLAHQQQIEMLQAKIREGEEKLDKISQEKAQALDELSNREKALREALEKQICELQNAQPVRDERTPSPLTALKRELEAARKKYEELDTAHQYVLSDNTRISKQFEELQAKAEELKILKAEHHQLKERVNVLEAQNEKMSEKIERTQSSPEKLRRAESAEKRLIEENKKLVEDLKVTQDECEKDRAKYQNIEREKQQLKEKCEEQAQYLIQLENDIAFLRTGAHIMEQFAKTWDDATRTQFERHVEAQNASAQPVSKEPSSPTK